MTEEAVSRGRVGDELFALVRHLQPIPRSLTGDGVRATLEAVSRIAPLRQVEVPTGTVVLDWEIPASGTCARRISRTLPDAASSTSPTRRFTSSATAPRCVPAWPLDELQSHLHSLPDDPELVPYRTSYWREDWGFCVAEAVRSTLAEGEYDVVIDASLEPGSLTYGEAFLPGKSEDEVLVSCHVCHPTLCNDGLAGIAVAAFLARAVDSMPSGACRTDFCSCPARSVRSRGSPRTTWRCSASSMGSCSRAPATPAPRRTSGAAVGPRRSTARSSCALRDKGAEFSVRDFSPYGYDERQYCSPGFDLPVGCLMRTPYGEYAEYHTSADDLELVRPQSLEDTFDTCLRVVDILERSRVYVNLKPKGEPRLGRYGLYGSLGGGHHGEQQQLALLWVLNQSDGSNALLDVAERSGLSFALIAEAADRLVGAGLLEEKA